VCVCVCVCVFVCVPVCANVYVCPHTNMNSRYTQMVASIPEDEEKLFKTTIIGKVSAWIECVGVSRCQYVCASRNVCNVRRVLLCLECMPCISLWGSDGSRTFLCQAHLLMSSACACSTCRT
jgi:hypothetical protein